MLKYFPTRMREALFENARESLCEPSYHLLKNTPNYFVKNKVPYEYTAYASQFLSIPELEKRRRKRVNVPQQGSVGKMYDREEFWGEILTAVRKWPTDKPPKIEIFAAKIPSLKNSTNPLNTSDETTEFSEMVMPATSQMEELPANVTRFLTVEEVALMLRCKPRTIYKMVSQRRIPYRKAGRQLLFDPKEIDQWTKTSACDK
jgi:excisionase family DNA binding protein